jgi:hypothetical protein
MTFEIQINDFLAKYDLDLESLPQYLKSFPESLWNTPSGEIKNIISRLESIRDVIIGISENKNTNILPFLDRKIRECYDIYGQNIGKSRKQLLFDHVIKGKLLEIADLKIQFIF